MTFAIRSWRPQARRRAIAPRFFDDEWFARPFRQAFHDSPGWLPPVDIEETDDAVVVRASVPGFRPQDLEITTAEGDLIIQGAHDDGSQAESDEGSRYHVRERRAGRFYRRVPLPVRTTAAGAGARYENGVLTVRVPKAEEARAASIAIEPA
ncbi:MAG: Hsp20/alpha crystallin family protein [Chloroflexi bacterium]|nr:Hsp20/alpha crystallin family protein [Chloroflexota bacterium]